MYIHIQETNNFKYALIQKDNRIQYLLYNLEINISILFWHSTSYQEKLFDYRCNVNTLF